METPSVVFYEHNFDDTIIQSLSKNVLNLGNECRALAEENKRLKSLCDCLGMGGKHTITELEAENARLKTEVEHLMVFCNCTLIPNKELQAEVERLTKERDKALTDFWYIHEGYFRLEAEVNRLTAAKEGNSMWGVVAPYVVPPCIDKYTAKEGKQP